MTQAIRYPAPIFGIPGGSQPLGTLAGPTQAFPLDVLSKGMAHTQVRFAGGPVTVEVTDSDVYDSTVTPTWFNHTDAGAVNATVPFTTAFLSVPKAIRFNGTATNFEAIIVQNGH